jgi:hypothetical protein
MASSSETRAVGAAQILLRELGGRPWLAGPLAAALPRGLDLLDSAQAKLSYFKYWLLGGSPGMRRLARAENLFDAETLLALLKWDGLRRCRVYLLIDRLPRLQSLLPPDEEKRYLRESARAGNLAALAEAERIGALARIGGTALLLGVLPFASRPAAQWIFAHCELGLAAPEIAAAFRENRGVAWGDYLQDGVAAEMAARLPLDEEGSGFLLAAQIAAAEDALFREFGGYRDVDGSDTCISDLKFARLNPRYKVLCAYRDAVYGSHHKKNAALDNEAELDSLLSDLARLTIQHRVRCGWKKAKRHFREARHAEINPGALVTAYNLAQLSAKSER